MSRRAARAGSMPVVPAGGEVGAVPLSTPVSPHSASFSSAGSLMPIPGFRQADACGRAVIRPTPPDVPRRVAISAAAINGPAMAIGGTLRRHRQGSYWIDLLSLGSERLTAGCQHMHRRGGVQQRVDHQGRAVDHLLAIVEHDQRCFAGKRSRHPLRRHQTRGKGGADRRGDRQRDEIGVRERRQLDKPDAMRELG